MRIKQAMSQDFKLITPDTTIREAAQLMKEEGCGYLPVGENDRLTGAITDRDIAIRAVAEGHDPQTTAVKDIMTTRIIYCYEDETVEEAAEKMKKKQIRRLAVLNKAKRMTGVISLGDIAQSCKDLKLVGEIETEICKMA